MAARFFLVGESGDAGAWLVDVRQRTVERIDAEMMAEVREELAMSGELAGVQSGGAAGAIAASESLSAASSHNWGEPVRGGDMAVATESLSAASSHNWGEPVRGGDIAVASESLSAASSHNWGEPVRGGDMAVASESLSVVSPRHWREPIGDRPTA
ncbi:hypothetical protein HDIA_2543 [Hartmannibacter diazotrophicus]|uniref:Uncharacterized protein n=1 Tax=Hartmannibacter diazotrophicus TaxID=1482074 RepID=A0A2C9D6X7_9HYPH|nr:hypothetical protein [Hartmannibacter diazotrophicus]SON56084.1 hypothetical protein HDIA_2543 [Hartmannibacter diazotrophicus]